MEKIIKNEVGFAEMMKKFSLDEIIEFREKSSDWNDAVKKYLGSKRKLTFGDLYESEILGMSIAMNMSYDAVEHNCLSTKYFFKNKLEEILNLFPNLEEFYLSNSYSLDDKMELLEILNRSCPNIKKLMFYTERLRLDSSGFHYLDDKKVYQKHLNDLLKEFKSLKTVSLYGSPRSDNRDICYDEDRNKRSTDDLTECINEHFSNSFTFTASKDFEKFENINNFNVNPFSFICEIYYNLNDPFTPNTGYAHTLKYHFVDYKIENGEEHFQNFISRLIKFYKYETLNVSTIELDLFIIFKNYYFLHFVIRNLVICLI